MTQAGIVINWGATHRDGRGVIISRQVAIEAPGMIECVRLSCLWKYMIKSLRYTLIMLYHRYRVAYAESHRNKHMPAHYRLGEPSPETIWGAIREILILRMLFLHF